MAMTWFWNEVGDVGCVCIHVELLKKIEGATFFKRINLLGFGGGDESAVVWVFSYTNLQNSCTGGVWWCFLNVCVAGVWSVGVGCSDAWVVVRGGA